MRYRKYGLAGLARNDRVDRGQQRAITPELKEILEALALQKPPLPIAALHRQLYRIAIERGQPIPNYKAVYRVVRHLPADLPGARGRDCYAKGNLAGPKSATA